MLQRIRLAFRMIDWRKVKVKFGECPLCGKTIFIKLNDNEWAIRCFFCGAAPNSMAIGIVLKRLLKKFASMRIYILSSSGPLFDFLSKSAGELVFSQYFDDIYPGEYKGNTQCQDVQQLTYNNGSFDICISSEVFEHVPDDIGGFRRFSEF